MPTIDLTDEEHAAAIAAIRRAVEQDRFPRALRLGQTAVGALREALIRQRPPAGLKEAPMRRQGGARARAKARGPVWGWG
jgi:hypothetical protein